MPIILDEAEPLKVNVEQYKTEVISVAGPAVTPDERLSITYIANLLKAKATTGTLLYDCTLYLNGDAQPTLSSGVYRQSVLAGETAVVLNLSDFYSTLHLLPNVRSFKIKINAEFDPIVNGKIGLVNQRLHVELK